MTFTDNSESLKGGETTTVFPFVLIALLQKLCQANNKTGSFE
jgi:hypothetical protein